MALGHARSTGNPGVYCVVPGPGVLNTAAALCTAYATNAPVLCLTGQIPSEGLGRGIGYLHELPDQLATLSTLTRGSECIMTPEAAPDVVNKAFRQMLGGRQGPVSLEMPMDIMARKGRVKLLPPVAVPPAGDVDPEAVAAAARMMAKSRAPMIVAGGGAIGAREELKELAERLQAPVVTFRNGRGIVSDRSYLSQNLVAGYELWRTADLVMGIGSRMEQQYLHWGMPEGRGVIRIDIDPEEIARPPGPGRGAELRCRGSHCGNPASFRRNHRNAAVQGRRVGRPEGFRTQANRARAAPGRLPGCDPRCASGRRLPGR